MNYLRKTSQTQKIPNKLLRELTFFILLKFIEIVELKKLKNRQNQIIF